MSDCDERGTIEEHRRPSALPPLVVSDPTVWSQVMLDCSDCSTEQLFVTPECDEHPIGCPERVCVECGAAVVLVQPTAQPRVSRTLRRVA
ncbi:MAG TPA: hypothetical protein VHV82_19705 [Sporichthyaceae bacterium]|nr:hypothetical protein [Sporichthyaceae bacterium]